MLLALGFKVGAAPQHVSDIVDFAASATAAKPLVPRRRQARSPDSCGDRQPVRSGSQLCQALPSVRGPDGLQVAAGPKVSCVTDPTMLTRLRYEHRRGGACRQTAELQ